MKGKCFNCGNVDEFEDDSKMFPNIQGILERLEPGGTVPVGECSQCTCLSYPMESEQQVSLRLTIDVRYEIGSTQISELENILMASAAFLAAEGLLEAETDATVTQWGAKVKVMGAKV